MVFLFSWVSECVGVCVLVLVCDEVLVFVVFVFV